MTIEGRGAGDRITLLSTGIQLTNDADEDLTHSAVESFTVNGYGGNDKLTGTAAGETLVGGAGDDIIEGGAGADDLDGGFGIDTTVYAGSPQGVTVNLGGASTGPQSASGGHADGEFIAGFENVTGSEFADSLSGSSAANVLLGLLGNDRLSGFAANDTLRGMGGTDGFEGGAGTDTCDNRGGEQATGCEK